MKNKLELVDYIAAGYFAWAILNIIRYGFSYPWIPVYLIMAGLYTYLKFFKRK